MEALLYGTFAIKGVARLTTYLAMHFVASQDFRSKHSVREPALVVWPLP